MAQQIDGFVTSKSAHLQYLILQPLAACNPFVLEAATSAGRGNAR